MPDVTRIEHRPGPEARARRVAVESGQLDRANHAEIMIPGHTHVRVFADTTNASGGIGTVANDIAKNPQLVEAPVTSGILQHRVECREVGVDVGDYKAPRHAPAL